MSNVERMTAAEYRARKAPKPAKYRNRKVVVDGITFDSRREASRWIYLRGLQDAGEISELTRQRSYEIAPGVRLNGDKRARPAVRCVVDFDYYHKRRKERVVEDVKGFDTPMSRLKRHLLKAIHGIDVKVIR